MRKTTIHIDRREFLRRSAATCTAAGGYSLGTGTLAASDEKSEGKQQALRKDWLARWEKNILNDARNRYCDKETGEEIGWLISPFLNGFYYGYLATHDSKWVDMSMDWANAWIQRGVAEPDGYVGWPKADGASTTVVPDLYTDNQLGEAMGLHPVVLMADTILENAVAPAEARAKGRGVHQAGRADL